jgi:hypothetical protein
VHSPPRLGKQVGRGGPRVTRMNNDTMSSVVFRPMKMRVAPPSLFHRTLGFRFGLSMCGLPGSEANKHQKQGEVEKLRSASAAGGSVLLIGS